MEHTAKITHIHPQVISVGNKAIGPYYWVGHCMNGVDYYAGQTFKSTADGYLRRIKLFPSIVFGNTDANLSIYVFDQPTQTWREKKAEATRYISKAMEGHWISFEVPNLPVQKGNNYAFKLTCNNGGMLAIAECPWDVFNSYPDGQEWVGSSVSTEGRFHRDFDLAFEAEIEPMPSNA